MPGTQDDYCYGSPCTCQQSPSFLLPPVEPQEPQPNSQAYCSQLICSPSGNCLSEFVMPSYIDCCWLHDLSTTVGTYPSATCHFLHPDDQRQTLDSSPDTPVMPIFTFSDPDKVLPSVSRCSEIDKFDLLKFSNSPTLDPRALEATSNSHGEMPLNYEQLSSNATLRKHKRRSDMEELKNARALKRRRFNSLYPKEHDVKLPYLGNFQYEDMSNRRKVTLIDNSPPLPHQTNRADKGQEDKVDTFSQGKPKPKMTKGDAAHAILELSKRDLVVSKEVINIPYPTKNRVAARTISK